MDNNVLMSPDASFSEHGKGKWFLFESKLDEWCQLRIVSPAAIFVGIALN